MYKVLWRSSCLFKRSFSIVYILWKQGQTWQSQSPRGILGQKCVQPKGKLAQKFCILPFSWVKNKLLNKRKITNFEKVLNSWKVCWKRAFPVKQRVCVREFSMCQALIFWMKGISFPTGLNNKLFFLFSHWSEFQIDYWILFEFPVWSNFCFSLFTGKISTKFVERT